MVKEDKSEHREEPPEESGVGCLAIPEEVLKQIPPEFRTRIREMSMTMMAGSFPSAHPIIEKLNSEHIDKILDMAERDSEREAAGERRGGKYAFVGFLAVLASAVGLVIFLTLQKETTILMNILIAALSFGGGFGGGYGYSRYAQRR